MEVSDQVHTPGRFTHRIALLSAFQSRLHAVAP
jgi:hypothetical protein